MLDTALYVNSESTPQNYRIFHLVDRGIPINVHCYKVHKMSRVISKVPESFCGGMTVVFLFERISLFLSSLGMFVSLTVYLDCLPDAFSPLKNQGSQFAFTQTRPTKPHHVAHPAPPHGDHLHA